MQLLANTTSPYARVARVAMIEKNLHVEPTLVDPWADDTRLREANPATRVPSLILDNGVVLTESLLIVQWLEATRPAPQWPSLLGNSPKQIASVLSRAGLALGVIDAAVHTLITRKVTAPVLFDETPVGLRRQRTMVEGLERLDSVVSAMDAAEDHVPCIDVICAVVLYDYVHLRFGDQPWLPATPALKQLVLALKSRPSFSQTLPRIS